MVTYVADDVLWYLLHAVGEGGVRQGLPVRAPLASYPILLLGRLSLRGHDATPDRASRAQGSLRAPNSIAPRRCPPHSGATGPGHRLSGGPPPPQSLLPARPPSLPDDGRAGSVGRTGDQCWLGRSGHRGPGPPLGDPPHLDVASEERGGPEAGLICLSHHKVLPWAGRGSAGARLGEPLPSGPCSQASSRP